MTKLRGHAEVCALSSHSIPCRMCAGGVTDCRVTTSCYARLMLLNHLSRKLMLALARLAKLAVYLSDSSS